MLGFKSQLVTFQCGHAMCQLNLFSTGINSSSHVIQNKGRWLIYLFGFHFAKSGTQGIVL